MNYQLEFISFYNQFYLCDSLSGLQTDNNFWTEEAYLSRLAVLDDIIGVSTSNEELARVKLFTMTKYEPEKLVEGCDHIVEASMQINSGVLQLRACPDSRLELAVNVPAGVYGVRVCSFYLADDSKDRYEIFCWPDKMRERVVLLQWDNKS